MLASHAVDRPAAATTGDVRPNARRGERGAILVHAAVALAGLLAFSALTIDLGSVWVVRAQVQNAADAAALAGTASLAYVNPTDMEAAKAASRAIASAHSAWGQAIPPAATQVTTGACPTGSPAVAGDCVNVTVGRGADYGTPMPTFFAGLIGGPAANISASASGKVLTGNTVSCPRPIALPDSWFDSHDTVAPTDSAWTAEDIYDRYPDAGHATPPPDADTYVPPDAGGSGSGFTLAAMSGRRIQREVHRSWDLEPLLAGHFLTLDMPRPGGSSDFEERFSENFASCSGQPLSIGQSYDVVYTRLTRAATESLIAQDEGAYWDGTAIRGGDPRFLVSPRLITIAVVDPDAFARQSRPGSDVRATVRNIVGLFLERTFEADLQGVIVPASGTLDPRAPRLTDASTFLRGVALVR